MRNSSSFHQLKNFVFALVGLEPGEKELGLRALCASGGSSASSRHVRETLFTAFSLAARITLILVSWCSEAFTIDIGASMALLVVIHHGPASTSRSWGRSRPG